MNSSTNENNDYPQYTLLQTFGLSVIPGILIAAVFTILTPVVRNLGYPPLFAFLLAFIFAGIPFELGVLLYLGHKRNERFSLNGIVLYRDAIPLWQYFVIIPVALVLAFGVITLLLPVESSIARSLFTWLPEWLFMEDPDQYAAYNRSVLLVTFGLALFVRGIAIPIVEELYFRGFLLPRLSRFKIWAPVIGGFFFALYHVWQPMAFITVFVTGVILGALVQWKRNVYLSIIGHMLSNSFSAVMALMLVVGAD